MLILSVESSCDETACAIVKDGVEEIVSSLATSKEMHISTGGVVPEVAARKQVESVVSVIADVVSKFKIIKGLDDNMRDEDILKEHIDAIAVTVGPGLIGSLLVGVEAAKALSFALEKPLIPVNHLMGHIYANYLSETKDDSENTEARDIRFPFIGLVVSGGHTDLVLAKDHYDLEYLGGTLDDAAGEAFDKIARMLGISMYMGGAQLSKVASECIEDLYKGELPRPMIHKEGYDFSFSGLKTSVKRFIEKTEDLDVSCLAKDFEDSVVEVLVKKTLDAAMEYNVRTVLLGGGVSANRKLREVLRAACENKRINLYYPPLRLCGDNAVYIASAAYFLQKVKGLDTFREINYSGISPVPSMGIMDM